MKNCRMRLRFAVLASIVLLPLAYCVAIIIDHPKWVRGLSEWYWLREQAPFSWLWFVPALLIAGWVVWIWTYLKHRRRIPAWLILVSAVIMTGILPYAMLVPRGHPIQISYRAAASGVSSGFFQVGTRIKDPNHFLIEHIDLLDDYSEIHVRTSPPGNPLLFWGASKVLAKVPWLADGIGYYLRRVGCNPEFEGKTLAEVSSIALQLVLTFVAGLGVLPLFVLGRAWFGRRTALLLVGLFPLLPGITSFAPSFNLLYLTLASISLWLTWEAFHRQSLLIYFLNGVLLSVASFLSFGNLIFLVLDLTMLAAWLSIGTRRSSQWKHAFWGGILMSVGTTTAWMIYWLGWGVSGLELYQRAVTIHTSLVRTYWKWALYNPYDVLSWTGLALWGPLLWHVGHLHIRWGSPMAKYRSAYMAALVVFSVGLNLSGMVLGETARILLFLSPLLLLVGAAGAVQLGHKAVRLITFGLAFQTLVAGLWLWPVQTQWQQNRFVAPQYSMPLGVSETNYTLADAILLNGYLYDKYGDTVTLYWKSLQPTTASYTVFVHVVDSQGHVVASHDSPPQENNLYTFCWIPGEVVPDTHPIELAPGSYNLLVGMYHWPDLQRLSVTPAQPNDVILLGEIHK